jgi:hypothetical protein
MTACRPNHHRAKGHSQFAPLEWHWAMHANGVEHFPFQMGD